MQYFRLLITATILSFSLSILAQEDTSKDVMPKWWINLGAGSGTNFKNNNADIDIGVSAHLSFNGAFTKHFFSTFYLNGLVNADDHYPDRNISDIGILLGYVNKKARGYWSLSSGIAHYYMETDYPHYYYYRNQYSKSKSGVALPVQAQAFWTPFKHFGLGIIGHAVVVPEPYVTAMLAIQIQG